MFLLDYFLSALKKPHARTSRMTVYTVMYRHNSRAWCRWTLARSMFHSILSAVFFPSLFLHRIASIHRWASHFRELNSWLIDFRQLWIGQISFHIYFDNEAFNTLSLNTFKFDNLIILWERKSLRNGVSRRISKRFGPLVGSIYVSYRLVNDTVVTNQSPLPLYFHRLYSGHTRSRRASWDSDKMNRLCR